MLAQHINPQDGMVALYSRIGCYGFSFPQWRFFSAAFCGLQPVRAFRAYGLSVLMMCALPIYPRLIPSGMNMVSALYVIRELWYIEYRRAYVLCACRKAGMRWRLSSATALTSLGATGCLMRRRWSGRCQPASAFDAGAYAPCPKQWARAMRLIKSGGCRISSII